MTCATVSEATNPFEGGWAVIPFAHRAHLWRQMERQDELRRLLDAPAGVTFYEAACGYCRAASKRVPPQPNLSPDFPKCRRCARSEAAA